MNENNRKYHLNVLSIHNHMMYEDLIHEHNITSGSEMEIEFEGYDTISGYFALKNKKKYFIDSTHIEQLPIKIELVNCQRLVYQNHVTYRPMIIKPFKIKPEKTFKSFKEFLDTFCSFEHSDPTVWTLLKLIALQGYISKVFVCIATNPEFGKSSIYDVMHGITDKCPVFKPRSVPGVLNKINGVGNIVFDDVLEARKDVREIMEEFSLAVAGGKSVYINGAMRASRTKSKYSCRNQSITFLYNTMECYKNPEKNYFDNLFENNKAIDTRFIKLKFDGMLTEKFSKNFNMEKCATDNKMHYINVAKYLLWLQDLKKKDGYKRRWVDVSVLKLKGRRRNIYDDITWITDMYASNQGEYNVLIQALDKAVMDYRVMVNDLVNDISPSEEYVR